MDSMIKVCPVCKTQFETKRERQTYCCVKCRDKAYSDELKLANKREKHKFNIFVNYL